MKLNKADVRKIAEDLNEMERQIERTDIDEYLRKENVGAYFYIQSLLINQSMENAIKVYEMREQLKAS